jgi:hypothetical protein
MPKKAKAVRRYLSITDISGSKAEADRIRALDRVRQDELRQDLVARSKANAASKPVVKRVTAVKKESLLTVPESTRSGVSKIPSKDTGGYAGVPLPPLTAAERKAKAALDKGVVSIRTPNRKRKKKMKTPDDGKTSSDLLDSRLMYRGSYGMGKNSRGY